MFTDKRALGIGVGVALILLAIASLFFTGGGGIQAASRRAFYTVDDGASWFADDASKLPPFDHDGKQAVRAYIYEAAGGKRFVNHLERYTPQGQRITQEGTNATKAGKAPPKTPIGTVVTEVKRPGGEWVSAADYAKSAPVMAIKMPTGLSGEATPVDP